MAILEAKALIAGRFEAEQAVGPVVNLGNLFAQ
jgi:hypothetical protein